MKKLIVLLMLCFSFLSFSQNFNSSKFVKETGTMLYFNPVSVSSGFGVFGFNLSVSAGIVDISQSTWNSAIPSLDNTITFTEVSLRKGLTDDLAVGITLRDYSDINSNSWGISANYRLIHGNALFPSVVARVTYSNLTGNSYMDAYSYSAGLFASKGILFFTPYGGVSYLKSHVKYKGDLLPHFSNSESQVLIMGGVRMSLLPVLNLNAQVVKGEATVYRINASVKF
ncbi:hypothetical protein TTHT_1591 [Thermotomaculum hydrothermale]|uniref:Uncharacterized protein n=1 Tax=Thermotomaculum hydrothermale TaxID=981385 RepID=A0A7R6PYB7_9BACT|nr:hypothetical protein [Thermotomaculum hydrothermale]BBB33080.1 hypothetical protein TTHT_1591 [Thermotomaculum hydrothermale]